MRKILMNMIFANIQRLEARLEEFTPSRTNITREQLDSQCTHQFPAIYEGKEETRFAFFFETQDGALLVPIDGHRDLLVPLSPEKFGFPSAKPVFMQPQHDPEVKSNSRGHAIYEMICRYDRNGAMDLLRKVGIISNHSMRYDVHGLRQLIADAYEQKLEKDDRDVSIYDAQRIVDLMVGEEREKYKPSPREVWPGLCTDACENSIKVLKSLGLQDMAFTYVGVGESLGPKHATIVMFDLTDGEWGVLNTKDPAYPINIPTKEQVLKFGRPYQ